MSTIEGTMMDIGYPKVIDCCHINVVNSSLLVGLCGNNLFSWSNPSSTNEGCKKDNIVMNRCSINWFRAWSNIFEGRKWQQDSTISYLSLGYINGTSKNIVYSMFVHSAHYETVLTMDNDWIGKVRHFSMFCTNTSSKKR